MTRSGKNGNRERTTFMLGFFKKRWMWAILGIAAAGAIGVGIWADDTFADAQAITPQAIIQEYLSNDIASDFKYVDRPVIATGLVASVSDASMANMQTRLLIELQDENSSDPTNRIECWFSKTLSETPEAADLAVGQKVTIEGTFIGYSVLPMMGGCSIMGTQSPA